MNYIQKRKQQQMRRHFIFKPFNRHYPLKKEYSPVIPLNIYQTWNTKQLPPRMQQRVDLLKLQNPRFNHYLYDDTDCYEFIKNNFEEKVLNAYEQLIPGAYKADLWRLCILYIYGGFYLDIIKDRQYTTQENSHARRSAQTAIYYIIKTLYKIVYMLHCLD